MLVNFTVGWCCGISLRFTDEDGNELTHTPIGSQLSVDESSLSHITAR